jgi:hypothetical protein
MEWLANALKIVNKVYLESAGTSRKLTLVNGAVVRLYDGTLYVGGALNGKPAKVADVLFYGSDGSLLRVTGLEIDIIEDGYDTYFNGRSKIGRTKVLYISGEDAPVRIELGGTL